MAILDTVPPGVYIILGETDIGKTFKTNQEIALYIRDLPGVGKHARKVLIFDNNDEYGHLKTLDATVKGINDFMDQSKIEARRIVGIENGMPMSTKRKMDMARLIVTHFRNGLIGFDDIDKYGKHNNDQDVIAALCGGRHIGCDVMISHQAWRKISVSESENPTILRIHHTSDDIDALPPEKKDNFPYEICKIACIIVGEMYDWANDDYMDGNGTIKKEEWHIRKSFFLYIDVRKKKMWPIAQPEVFKRAARKYFVNRPKDVQDEMNQMYMDKIITEKKSLESQEKAIASLIKKRMHYLK